MIDSKFLAECILKLYIQVITYSVPITIIMLFLNRENVSIKESGTWVFAVLGRGLWFASAYITLMLFKPLLDKILHWSKKNLAFWWDYC